MSTTEVFSIAFEIAIIPAPLSNMAETEIRRAPKLGEDNVAILKEMLGFNNDQIEALRDSGAI